MLNPLTHRARLFFSLVIVLGLVLVMEPTWVLSAGAAGGSKARQSFLPCNGPFKKKSPSAKALRAALTAHALWLDEEAHQNARAANLCHADLKSARSRERPSNA